MLGHVLSFATQQRWLIVSLAAASAVLGAWSFSRLPIDAVPDGTNKQVQINTGVTGLAPVEIEKQITAPIEWAMQGIPGVEEIRSVSFYGVSQVTVIFEDDVDIYRARQLVSERLAEARESLPAGVGTPFLGPIWTGLGEIYFWSVDAAGPKPDGTEYTSTDLRTIQDWIIKPQLRSVPGLTEVNSTGGYEKQFHVTPDPMKLMAYGLSFRDVLEALAANNANVGGGYIEHGGQQYTIRATGLIQTVDDIRNVKLGTHDGVPIYVKDVAEVALGKELRTGTGTANGHEAVVAAIVAATLLLASRMGSEFVPKLGEGALALQPTRMPSIALTTSLEMQERVEQTLLEEFPDEIAAIFARTGTSEVVTDVCGPEVSDTYMLLKPRERWTRAKTQEALAEAMAQVVKDLPGQNYEFSQAIELRMNELIAGVRSDLAVKIYGDDLDTLLQYANRIAEELGVVAGAEDLKIEQFAGMPMITIDIDRAAVARYGLNVKDVQEVVEIALGGVEAGQVIEGDRRFPLVVRMPERLRGNIGGIGDLPIPLPKRETESGVPIGEHRHNRRFRDEESGMAGSAGYIPLSSLAKIELGEGARVIRREDGKRRAVVQCNVRGRDLGSFVANAQRRIEQKIGHLPEGYWLGWGGQYENLVAARQRLTIVVPLALGLIFILLFATFNSVRQAVLVFTGVPLALTGGVLALWLRGSPFSISAGVGFIALSGVAVLNGLVMVSFINQLRREGLGLHESIVQGSLTRLRPVLMTALVASLGFVPMAIATGTGAEVQRPLATVVIGGISSSTLLTLVVLPAAYAWFDGRGSSREWASTP